MRAAGSVATLTPCARLFALAGGALLLSACASAAPEADTGPWALIADVERATYSVDTSRVERHADYVSVWLRVDFKEPQPLGADGRYQTTTIQQDLRCAERISRSRRMNAFMPGEDSTQYFVFPDTAWKPFDQQPLEEVYSRGACMTLTRLGKLPVSP